MSYHHEEATGVLDIHSAIITSSGLHGHPFTSLYPFIKLLLSPPFRESGGLLPAAPHFALAMNLLTVVGNGRREGTSEVGWKEGRNSTDHWFSNCGTCSTSGTRAQFYSIIDLYNKSSIIDLKT